MEQEDIDKKLSQLYKSNRKSGMLYTLIPLTIILAVLLVFWTRLDQRDKELDEKSQALEQKEKMLQEKEDRINELDTYAGKQDSVLLQINTQISAVSYEDPDSSTIYFQRIEQVNIADTSISRLIEQKSVDKKVKVQYYKQASDGGKVIAAMNELGLGYDTLYSKIQHNTGPINSVKYGSDVDMNTVNLVVLQLIKEGFEIRSIEPLANSTGREDHLIIYRSSLVLNSPVITAETVINRKTL